MNSLSTQEKDEGWKLLFDGKTTNGWHGYNKAIIGQAWQVAAGTLYFDDRGNNEEEKLTGGDIVTDLLFSNFHLKIEWKISVKGNSGIMFHVQEDTKYKAPWMTGPEMQLLDNEGHKDGGHTKHRAGELYDLVACSKETVKPPGEWNQAEIICNNGNLRFLLNGEEVVTTTLWNDAWKELVAGSKFNNMEDFAKFRTGRIALQDHGDQVWFRNVKIKGL